MFDHLDHNGPVWTDGDQSVDVIIWCTGFRPALSHLAPLRLRAPDGIIHTVGTRAIPGMHLLGYGDWTGPASATLIGVGPTARAAVTDLATHLIPS
ncbi:hypothetical protein ALI144C_07000 [Actinosynnema sp. ALI-1.44]|nr:hypothetical protein ALI144C_07000 [Actinosynnema sp. ALI-1.44]